MNKAIIFLFGTLFYSFSLLLSYLLFDVSLMPLPWIIWHFIVLLFFFGGFYLLYNTIYLPEKKFIRLLIFGNFTIKIISLTLTYFFYKHISPLPIPSNDAEYYYTIGKEIAINFRNFNFDFIPIIPIYSFSDLGALLYYAIIYTIIGDNIYIAGLINVIFATYSIIIFYKIIKQIDNEYIAKLSAIIMSLIPVFNLYVGTHLKEIIFIWLILKGTYLVINFNVKGLKIISILIIIFFLFTLRTVLAYQFIFAFIIYLFFTNYKNIQFGIKLFYFFLIFISLFLIIVNTGIREETDLYFNKKGLSAKDVVINTRIEQRGNNSITTSFFNLPTQIFFTIFGPFPTLVDYNFNKNAIIGLRTLISDSFVKCFLAFYFLFSLFNIKALKQNYFISIFLISGIILLSLSGLSLNFRFFLLYYPFFIYFSVLGFINSNIKTIIFLFIYFILMVSIYLFFNYNKLIEFA